MRASYKSALGEWAVGSYGISLKHTDGKDHALHTTTVLVPAALAWAPKENAVNWAGTVCTLISAYRSHGVDLVRAIQSILVDGSLGAEKAFSMVLPDKPLHRDVRHVLQNVPSRPLLLEEERPSRGRKCLPPLSIPKASRY